MGGWRWLRRESLVSPGRGEDDSAAAGMGLGGNVTARIQVGRFVLEFGSPGERAPAWRRADSRSSALRAALSQPESPDALAGADEGIDDAESVTGKVARARAFHRPRGGQDHRPQGLREGGRRPTRRARAARPRGPPFAPARRELRDCLNWHQSKLASEPNSATESVFSSAIPTVRLIASGTGCGPGSKLSGARESAATARACKA